MSRVVSSVLFSTALLCLTAGGPAQLKAQAADEKKSAAVPSTRISAANRNSPLNLSGPWLLSIPGRADRLLNQPAELGDRQDDRVREFTLAKNFELIGEENDYVLLLGKFDDEDEVYLNGKRVGQTVESSHVIASVFVERYYFVPRRMLNFNGQNELRVKGVNLAGQYGAWGDDLGLVPIDYFFESFMERFRKRPEPGDLVLLMFITLLCGQIFWYTSNLIASGARNQEPAMILFCLGAILLIGAQIPQKYYVVPDKVLAWKFRALGLQVTMAGAALFLLGFLQRARESRRLRRALAGLALFNGVYFFICLFPDFPTSLRLFLVSNLLNLAALPLLTMLVVTDPERGRGHALVASGMLIALVTGIHDILRFYDIIIFDRRLNNWGLLAFTVAMVLLQSLRYIDIKLALKRLNVELSDLNRNLENKVTERTQELQAAKEHADEVHRAMRRDVDLAASLQRSFMPSRPPATENFDIAFLYKPAAEVSGDIIDFHTAGSTLRGASVFDVSGHGVAAGLYTMLARSVIARQLREMEHMGLGEIMNRINARLMQDIGESEIFLTGITLRPRGDQLDFVLAAHPPPMLFQNADSAVFVPEPAGNAPIGVPNLNEPYAEQSLPMKVGDTVLVFTDGLMESKAPDGEQFGRERIRIAFKSAASAYPNDVQKQLERLYTDLCNWSESEELSDDLTILLLRRAS